MATSLILKSEVQILGEAIAKFLAESGINDFNANSVVRTLLEAKAQEDFQQYFQMLNIIRNYNLDSTTGTDLDNRAAEFGLTRFPKRKATGLITISRESTFTKVSTELYAGLPAPTIGDTKLRVNDASNVLYGTSGTLIVGRGTANEEEVTYSTAPTDFTNYFEFTTSAFTNNHGLDETVILKQGTDQLIDAGTVVTVPATGTSPKINFTTDHAVTLLAGEAQVSNVDVTCTTEGEVGNIPIAAINGTTAFSEGEPFAGAQATNPAKFTTGADREIDDDLRNRIKNQIQSLSKGVKIAIKNAIIGLVDPATAKRVVSADVILPTTRTEPVRVYIDDGTGFEPSFESQGFEEIIDQATGGETRLQLDLAPLVKAHLISTAQEPFDMSAGTTTLTYTVGLLSETISIFTTDFAFPASATAQEIVTAINARANLIQARTADSGFAVEIEAATDTNEDIQVTGGTANAKLLFPTDQRATLFLYINDQLKSKDGSTAAVDSVIEDYDFAGIGSPPWPLNITVDGKIANPQVVNFNSGDFLNPSAALASEVVAVINAQLAGAKAVLINDDTQVRVISNTPLSSKSKLEVTGGSANSVLGFSTSEVDGTDSDYTLNRELGTIELNAPLAPNDSVTAASVFTRARLRTASPEFYNISLGETLIVTVDGGSPQTVTFGTTGLLSAATVAAIINSQLDGATAIVRTIAGQNFLELNTNTYAQSVGSLLVSSASTATALNFPLDTTITNQRPHRAFVVSTSGGPFSFVLTQNLVVIIDNSPATRTFTVVFNFDGSVTTGTSTTVFAASAFNQPFPSNGDLIDFYAIFKSGANTTTGTVDTITNQGGNTWRYAFTSLPSGLASFAAGDHVTFSAMQNNENNGNFLITSVNTSGNGYVQVTNANGIAESSSSGTALIGARRQITAYTGASGTITLGSALPATPSPSDTFAVLPSTLSNVVAYMNNLKATTLSTKAFIEASNVDTRIQISSKSNGSDGFVQVTGGSANSLLGFSTTKVQGLPGYNYFTGLSKLVHQTIYGDDTDLVTFPGVGAAGVEFQVLAPTVKEVSFNLVLTLNQGVTVTAIENDVRSVVSGYVNSLGIGEEVVVSEVIALVMDLDNVIDVRIVTPTQNIPVGSNQVARTRNSLIVVG